MNPELGSSTYKYTQRHQRREENKMITTKHPDTLNLEPRTLQGTFALGHSAVSVTWDGPLALVHPVLGCRDFRDHKAPRPTCHHTSTDKAQRGWTKRAHHGTKDFVPQKTFCTNLEVTKFHITCRQVASKNFSSSLSAPTWAMWSR